MKKIILSVLCSIFLLLSVTSDVILADDYIENDPIVNTVKPNDTKASKPVLPKVEAPSAICMDTVNGRVLYEKNAYSRRYIASTTKIMTAILAIENGNAEDIVTVSKKAAEI